MHGGTGLGDSKPPPSFPSISTIGLKCFASNNILDWLISLCENGMCNMGMYIHREI